jgi:hypothetical protein
VAIGTALPGVMLILVSCVAPLALFKLLAFTDPTTNSGAAFRSGLAAVGGIGGLIRSRGADAGADSVDTAEVDEPGTGGADQSAGEAAADDQTISRFGAQLAAVTGPAGAAVGGAIVTAHTVASAATAVGSDLTNQMGVGHTSWHPDQTTSPYAGGNPADNGGYAEQAGDVDRPAPDPNRSDWGRPLEAIDLGDSPDTDAGPRTPAPGAAATGTGTTGTGAAAIDGAASEAAAVPIVPA